MADPNPFIVKIPKGATEIDLGPILRPIMWAIREEIRTHDGRLHWGSPREKQASQIKPQEIDVVMRQAINGLRYQELARELDRPPLIKFLEDNDWIDEDGRGYTYVRSYYAKGDSWDYKGDRLHLHSPNEPLKLHVVHDVVGTLSYQAGKTNLEMIKKILSYRTLLDRIVNELD
jgi:hypothetical protein